MLTKLTRVFSGRYKSQLVEGSGTGYLRTACDYVHLNPVRARMLKAGERLLSYPWSSFGTYLAAPEHRPGWIRVDRLLGEHGIQADTAAGREQLERWMERRRAEETDPEAQQALRRGWCLGSGGFKRELLLRMESGLRRETTLTIKAIAARVCLGTSKAANAKLHRHMREGAKPRKGKARPAGRRT